MLLKPTLPGFPGFFKNVVDEVINGTSLSIPEVPCAFLIFTEAHTTYSEKFFKTLVDTLMLAPKSAVFAATNFISERAYSLQEVGDFVKRGCEVHYLEIGQIFKFQPSQGCSTLGAVLFKASSLFKSDEFRKLLDSSTSTLDSQRTYDNIVLNHVFEQIKSINGTGYFIDEVLFLES